MIFLAVTTGFIIENIRERLTELRAGENFLMDQEINQ